MGRLRRKLDSIGLSDFIQTRFGVGYVMVILVFFGSFLSSLFSTKITMKLRDFFIVYFERAYLTILIWGGLCMLLFR